MPLSTSEIAAIAEEIGDPVFFAEHVLGVTPWSKQSRFLRAAANRHRVAIRSGHKTGKSLGMAVLAIWWPFYWSVRGEDARVAITSASFEQVRNIIWREIRLLYNNARIPLGGTIYRDPRTGIEWPDGNQVFGFSTDEPERAAGISSPHLLYLIDEASFVPPEIFEAMEGNMAAGAHEVMASNPTRTAGNFFDAFHSKRRFWFTIHISSADSPNITGEKEIPGLATKAWVEEKKDEWGEDSPIYAVRVKGDFPGQGSDAVIGLGLVMEARERYDRTPEDGALRIGVDVARFGDDETIIQPVRGLKALPAVSVKSMDGLAVAGEVLVVVRKLRREHERVRVKVDEIGLGASPTDFLNHLEAAKNLGVDVVPVNVSKSADKDDVFANLRSQLCFDLREWLESGGAIPEDETLTQEMVTPVYQFDAKGRRKLTPKKDEKKLLGRSPDRRNALELAIYEPTPRRSIGGGNILL